jgi:hypothetical protein
VAHHPGEITCDLDPRQEIGSDGSEGEGHEAPASRDRGLGWHGSRPEPRISAFLPRATTFPEEPEKWLAGFRAFIDRGDRLLRQQWLHFDRFDRR